ncbi:MAG: hypothetical protein BWX73_00035 [Lentisphaerae bacterium ADurb.Bin082]|nr:MAG: hypothetical protein BWX73_00035 [Lentisphaerae bacterium ADurb.Bin082]
MMKIRQVPRQLQPVFPIADNKLSSLNRTKAIVLSRASFDMIVYTFNGFLVLFVNVFCFYLIARLPT